MGIQTLSGNSQFSVIEDIRKRKGIGSGTKGGENEEDLHRAIEHLSEDLYSKDVHFILELIQNAEDNSYSPEKDPQLVFQILPEDPTNTPGTEGALLVINNEKGFQEENVRAICKVGASTKSKREGYIGEKGIGFKSVFLVTSKPHIFSTGYQFSFQDTPDPEVGFGYIIPYWTTEIPELVKRHLDQTCILLPFRPGKCQVVEDELRQIAPETILFLDKLKALQISVKEKAITEVYRIDQFFPKVELHTDGIKRTYWLSEVEFPVPDGMKEEKREGISSRKVSVAFPIGSESFPEISIYAFLPTSPSLVSGLDFLVNADFLLSSNREQIQEHRSWNQWLRDCIPNAFLGGFLNMLQDQELRCNSYSYIPIEKGNRSPFFTPIVTTILKELREKEIILTDDGNWVIPDQARFASKEIRKLFAIGSVPAQLQRTKLVASELEGARYRDRLKSIGVKELTEKEIINCLKDDEWISSKDTAWFFELYKYLQNQSWATKDALLKIKSIPTSDGIIHCPSDLMGVYLPTPSADEVVKEYKESIEFSGMKFLDHQLYQSIHADLKLEEWAKETLILFELNISMICQELAIQLRAKIEGTDLSTLKWATKFICHHFKELSDNQKDVVKQNLPLLLATEKITKPKDWSSGNPLVFPEIFDLQKGWQIVFPDPEDREHMDILSNLYLEDVPKDDYDMWGSFFAAIGATQTPFPRLTECTYWWNPPESASAHLKEWLAISRDSSRSFTLNDWKAPDWLKKAKTNPENVDLKRAKALVSWLEAQTDDLNKSYWYNGWLKAKLSWFYYSNRSDSENSEIYFYIHNSPWIPTNKGLRRPAEVFIDRPEIREFFGNTVPYSKIKISDELLKWLKIRTSATFSEVLNLLETLAGLSPEEADAKFVSRLYAFLSERWKSETRREFAAKKLILVTRPKRRWLKLDEVIWPDRSDVFGEAFGYLETEYEGLRTFFVDKLDAKKDVDDEAYAQAWLNLMASGEESLDAKKTEAALEKIFPILLRTAKSDAKPRWWDAFIRSVKMWTQKDHFAPCREVFIPDDSDLQKAFAKEGVEYSWRPLKDSFADFMPLYSALGILSLVDSVSISAQASGTLLDLEESSFLTEEIKKSICIYIRHQMRDIYDQLKENGGLQKLLQTKEYLVENLNLTMSLPGKQTDFSNGVAYWDQSNGILYLSASFSKDQWSIDVPSVIARRLVSAQYSKDLEDFIGRVLGSSSTVIIGILNKRNWNIPDSEQSWIDALLQAQKETDRQGKQAEIKAGETTPETTEPESSNYPEGSQDTKSIEVQGATTETPEPQKQPENIPSSEEKIDEKDKSKPVHRSGQEKHSTENVDKANQQKYRTYVYVPHIDEIKDGSEDDPRSEVNNRGVAAVLIYEKKCKRHPKDMNTEQGNFEGYDIESRDEQSQICRYIEVKSTSEAWGSRGVTLSETQFSKAVELEDKYWLYIVEKALSENPTLIMIQNPALKAQYFVYDDGWKSVAETAEIYQPSTTLNF